MVAARWPTTVGGGAAARTTLLLYFFTFFRPFSSTLPSGPIPEIKTHKKQRLCTLDLQKKRKLLPLGCLNVSDLFVPPFALKRDDGDVVRLCDCRDRRPRVASASLVPGVVIRLCCD